MGRGLKLDFPGGAKEGTGLGITGKGGEADLTGKTVRQLFVRNMYRCIFNLPLSILGIQFFAFLF